MLRFLLTPVLVASLSLPASGQLIFSDDFQTVTTYDVASLLAPCYGGPPTKYTLIEAVSADVFNQQAVSGGGRLRISDFVLGPGIIPLSGASDFCIIGWLGLGVGCPGEPPVLRTSMPFTGQDICLYGGYLLNHYHLSQIDNGSGPGDQFGSDSAPGFAEVDEDSDGTTDGTIGVFGVDDDGDGTIDEPLDAPDMDEYQWAGVDGQPGVAGVDDDGENGIDDQGELTWPGSDDSDDTLGNQGLAAGMRLELATSTMIFLTVEPTSLGGDNQFSIREIVGLTLLLGPAPGNELAPGFYDPFTEYSYVFCSSGTCYGAMMWLGANLANPAETLGPVINSKHTSPGAEAVGVGAYSIENGKFSLIKNMTHLGNPNFSSTFWAINGDPLVHYPSPSADLDNDKDVDVNDFLTFSGCFAGSLVPPAGGCQNADADLDHDGDVDVNDFLTFSSCFNGSLKRPSTACFPPDLTACP